MIKTLYICNLLLLLPLSSISQDSINYGDVKSWAALPWKQDDADKVPVEELENRQDTAKVDVFFIHPTSYLMGFGWNADINNTVVNERTDIGSIKNQASVFNGSCRVFAPRYRQAVLRSFYPKNEKRGNEALDFAYQDVKAAFEYYLENYNEGRPIIIATHSQGTRHGVKLVREYFDGKPMQEKLVAAYLVGFAVKCNDFENIQSCERAGQTGCFVGWNTFKWGADEGVIRADFYDEACCINPLNWKADTTYASKELHLGSTAFTFFDNLDKGVVDAQCHNGKLWVNPPSGAKYANISRNYHIYDYNFFYGNIRENVAQQVKNYLESK